MKSSSRFLAYSLLLAVAPILLIVPQALAVPYEPGLGYSRIELAAAPRQLGPTDDYPGMWEYVYDVWGGNNSWTRFASISGFDADSIANQHTATTGEDRDGDGDILDTGVWQRWDSHSVGGYANWGGFRENSIYPSYWDYGSSTWKLGGTEVGGGNWPGQNTVFQYPNEWHTGDEYEVSAQEICVVQFGCGATTFSPYNSFRRWPGIIQDSDGLLGGDTLTFDSFVHTHAFWGQSNASLELTFRVVHPNAPGSIDWSTYHNGGSFSVEGTVTGPGLGIGCVVGDANCDGFVDIANDILTGFTNFTGPGSFGKTRSQGDVHGSASGATEILDPHDGDVDVSDILAMFGGFTGPPTDQGEGLLGVAAAGDPAIPDLIYDPATGEVVLFTDGASIIGYSLKSAGAFLAGGHTPILGGVATSLPTELAEAALSSSDGSIGFVFPLGLDLAGLAGLLTENTVSTGLGAPLVPFDLVVLGPVVPEPTTFSMATVGLVALGLLGWRRRSLS